MSDFFITEYKENPEKEESSVLNGKDFNDEEDFVITFMEEPQSKEEPHVDLLEFSELDTDELMDQTDSEAMSFRLPGATNYVEDNEEEQDDKEEEKEIETDWEHDRDPKHFMSYIIKSYPDGIPKHDGNSTLGCERAILYLTNLNKEISEALRIDNDDLLDLGALENIRVNMVKDVVKLKEHIKKLNKKHKKTSDELQNNEIIKEATTPHVQLVMTPFERAVSGIIINSVVSSGKPFEDVYEFLKEKYKLSPREELSIMQLLKDMGQPIFKDRGTIGDSKIDYERDGVDFLKNYFA